MIMRPLSPVLAADIVDNRLTYEWDEWDVHEYFDFPAEELESRLSLVSRRGSIALTLAVGEWICHRYSQVSSDPAPMQYLEAGWAEQLQPDTTSYFETDDDEWRGVIRGPLSIVMTIANDALFCLDEDDETAVRAAWMTNLARHVLPKSDTFDRWLDTVVERLTLYHPREESAPDSLAGDVYGLGRPVARELFDTTALFDRSMEPGLIDRLLKSVDPLNPFLAVNAPDDEE